MPLGIYISVPFCRSKCSYCNFASDVFSRSAFGRYVERACADIKQASTTAESIGGTFDPAADSIYLGGGTPTVLESRQLEQLFVTIWQNFCLLPEAEVTVECAPGTLTQEVLGTLVRCGVNRVSLGVQSWVDREAGAVGRLHKRTTVLDDLARLREAGISNINIDLIAGLPHQTRESWEYSLSETVASNVPHASVYMLEVDDESRLGRELIAGGARYHAHFVPDDDLTADLYLAACERLGAAGVSQYEISNFARRGFESRHNLKYWTRQPYLGFGVDAHSMLKAASSREGEAIRFSAADLLDEFLAGADLVLAPVSRKAALEETFFLGLRLNRGLDLRLVERDFGAGAVVDFGETIDECVSAGLLERAGDVVRLTGRGRLLSNEVFGRFIAEAATSVKMT